MSNASYNIEPTHAMQHNAVNPNQALVQPSQQVSVASGNDSHNVTYHVSSTPEGNIVVVLNAPVQSHGTCTSCGSEEVRISPANEFYSQSITIGPALPTNDQPSSTASNANQPQEIAALFEDTTFQEVQTLSEHILDHSSTQQSTDEQAMDVDTPQDSTQPAHTTTVPRARQGPSLASLNPDQALQVYLLHQQRIAGIAPQDMILMPNRQNSHQQQQQAGNSQRSTPAVIQISNNGGIHAPRIPPARFNAAALPIRTSPRRHGQNQSQAATQAENSTARPSGAAPDQSASASQRVDQDASQPSLNPESRPRATGPASESRPENEDQNEGSEGSGNIVSFDIVGALTSHPWIVKKITDHFSPNELINTCMASRRFYKFVKEHNAFITGPLSKRAFPYTRKIFNYVYYQKVFEYDPNPIRNLENNLQIHRTPKFKWFRMLNFRATTVGELMSLFKRYGYTLTSKCAKVLLKIWHLMTIPDNHRRGLVIQSRNLWSDLDIFHAIFIFAQIESYFALHNNGASPQEFRRLVMAQKSPLLLRDAMKGTALNTQYAVVKEFVHWCYNPRPNDDGTDLYGNSLDQVGKLQYEYFGHNGNTTRLRRPDEFILQECSDRNLDTFKMYSNFYVHSEHDPSLSKIYDTERDSFDFVKVIRQDARRTNTEDTYMEQVILDKY